MPSAWALSSRPLSYPLPYCKEGLVMFTRRISAQAVPICVRVLTAPPTLYIKSRCRLNTKVILFGSQMLMVLADPWKSATMSSSTIFLSHPHLLPSLILTSPCGRTSTSKIVYSRQTVILWAVLPRVFLVIKSIEMTTPTILIYIPKMILNMEIAIWIHFKLSFPFPMAYMSSLQIYFVQQTNLTVRLQSLKQRWHF